MWRPPTRLRSVLQSTLGLGWPLCSHHLFILASCFWKATPNTHCFSTALFYPTSSKQTFWPVCFPLNFPLFSPFHLLVVLLCWTSLVSLSPVACGGLWRASAPPCFFFFWQQYVAACTIFSIGRSSSRDDD